MPGYNEEKYLGRVLKKLKAVTNNIVFIDDGSTDKTAEIAQKNITHVLVHKVNLGKGAAMKTGCEYAFDQLSAKAVIFMDSDDQHDPQQLKLFFSELKKGSQVIFGVRKFSAERMPLSRFLGNKLFSALVTVLFHQYIPDIPSGFKALTKKAYHLVKWSSQGYEVEMEIAVKVAKSNIPFSTVEIETIYHDIEKGMNILDGLGVVMRLFQWRLGI